MECGPDNMWILGPKMEEFPIIAHKLSVVVIALQYKPQWKMM